MKQNWTIKNKKDDFEAICREHGICEVTARLLVNRDLKSYAERDSFLHPALERGMHPAEQLKNAKETADALIEAICEKEHIRIIGDYDVDGIVSVYVLYRTLCKAGAKVDYRIPDRIKDGYGINPQMVEEAKADGVQVILTCDNGISAREPVRMAKEAGIRVLITDHHDIPTVETEDDSFCRGRRQLLPEADLIVNPKQEGETYPYTGLCGAVVAYKVMCVLARKLSMDEDFMLQFLPYLATATICDVMELTGENRTIAALGIQAMKECGDFGIRALIEANELNQESIGAYHIGFVLGPCLNASGRLDTALKGLELLLSEEEEKARQLAKEVVSLNTARKDLTAKGVEEAVQIVENGEALDRVLVIYLPTVHESLAGIIAGRVRERYYRPTIILTDAQNGVKGSGRSIEGYPMAESLAECSHLLTMFGGHPMAAGMSLPKENIEALRRELNERCKLTEEELKEKISIDVMLPFGLVNEQVLAELKLLEPFGKGNPKPLFAERRVKILRASVLGKNANVLKLQAENTYGKQFDVLCFGNIEEFETEAKEAFGEEQVQRMFQGRENKVCLSMIYYPDKNEYRGNVTLQAVMQYWRFETQ
ncbi:MAG: single-stranded-DNA-specific exonuclease RecJ [Lachnospiraceae bacterium]